jgi:hypothetical protein
MSPMTVPLLRSIITQAKGLEVRRCGGMTLQDTEEIRIRPVIG